jgi:hypothetical protein
LTDLTHVFDHTGPIGVLWSDDNNVYFAAVAENTPAASRLSSLVELVNQMKAPADIAQNAVLEQARKHDPSIYVQTSLVAAASPEDYTYVEKSPYSITVDENDNVLGLAFIDGDQVTVREDGEWVYPDPDNAGFYENEFHFVSEEAVELFDRLVQGENPPTADDFDGVYV